MFGWLKGRKTYLVSLAGLALGVASMIPGIQIPAWGYVLALSLGGASLRAGMKKAEDAANGLKK